MDVTITYRGDSEQDKALLALRATDLHLALMEVNRELRIILKYNVDNHEDLLCRLESIYRETSELLSEFPE